MLLIDHNKTTDPRLNLAIEEYLLSNKAFDEPLLMLYTNEPAVIIGRNQNALEETDPDYLTAEGIHFVRRLSGGGAVYHDLGNLNFSFFRPDKKHLHNFAEFTRPIIRALARLGVVAEQRGKSDIFAAGKKISGNAQYTRAGRMFSHGTLLFDSDLEALRRALQPRQVQITSKAIQSVRSPVVNISQLAPEGATIETLKQAILNEVSGQGGIGQYIVTSADWEQIHKISAERYRQWDWNFGRSPRFEVHKSSTTPGGAIDVHIEVHKGLVQTVTIDAGFLDRSLADEFVSRLIGVRYARETLAAALANIDSTRNFGELNSADLLALLY